jgi:retinol dehydrogenase 13
LMMKIMRRVLRLFAKPPEQFAQKVLRLATAPEMANVSGQLFSPKGEPIQIPADRRDPAIRQALWETSAQLTKIADREISDGRKTA